MNNNAMGGKSWTRRLLSRIIAGEGFTDILELSSEPGEYRELLRHAGGEWTAPEDPVGFVPDRNFHVAVISNLIERMDQSAAVALYERTLARAEIVVLVTPVADAAGHRAVLDAFRDVVIYFTQDGIGTYVATLGHRHGPMIRRHHDPKVAVYGIFKNEEKFIRRCLESVLDADQVVLADTGSTDSTRAVIDQVKAEYPGLNLQVHDVHLAPFRFDDARNCALSFVDKDVDLCLSLDIDETPEPGWKRRLVNAWRPDYTRYNHKFKTIWSEGSESEHWHERIHVREGYRWTLPVHETLEYAGAEEVRWLPDLTIVQRPDLTKPRGSYRALLEISVSERPDVWRSWSFLAGECMQAGDWTDATRCLEAAMAIDGSDQAYLRRQMSHCRLRLGDPDGAVRELQAAVDAQPRLELFYDKAKLEASLGRTDAAFMTMHVGMLLKPAEPVIDYHYRREVWEDCHAFYAELKEGFSA